MESPEEEIFTYPDIPEISVDDSDVGDITPVSGGVHVEEPRADAQPPSSAPSPAQLEAIYAAASSGDIQQLQRLFRGAWEDHSIDAFTLANDATSRTGLTPLHAACSRGHLEAAQWCMCFLSMARTLHLRS